MATSDNANGRILVIDDDPGIRGMFRELLEDAGYTVMLEPPSDDALLALAAIAEAAPDLVILDLFTGHTVDRWPLLEAMRSAPALRDTPLIVCSGAIQQLTEHADVLARLQIAVVPKPFDIDHLLAVIAELRGESPAADAEGRG